MKILLTLVGLVLFVGLFFGGFALVVYGWEYAPGAPNVGLMVLGGMGIVLSIGAAGLMNRAAGYQGSAYSSQQAQQQFRQASQQAQQAHQQFVHRAHQHAQQAQQAPHHWHRP